MGLHQFGFTCIPGPAICTHNYARNFFFTYNCSRPSRIFVSFGVIQINPIQNSQIDQQKKLKAPKSRKRGRGRGGKHLTSKRARDLQDAVNARKQKLQVYDIYKLTISVKISGFHIN